MRDDKALEVLERIAGSVETALAGLAEFHNAIRLQGARYVAVAGAAGRVLASNAPGRLLGWSFHETAGAIATVLLRDSRDPGGEVVAFLDLPAGGSDTVWLGPAGVSLTEGLYVDVFAGDVQGTVYLGTDQA